MPTYYAQVSYTGDGSTTQYSITFDYIDSSHVKAYLDGVETSAFTVSSATLTFTSAPSNGVTVRIQRETPIDGRLVDFTDGSVLTESDLDRSADQNFYVAQEITDDQENNLQIDTDDKYDANSKVIKNVADPVNDNDAVNKGFISTNLPNINSVANNITNVNVVANNISDVVTVANDLNEAISEIETAADDLNLASSNIETVANNISNVNSVGGAISNINTIAGSIANVNSVASNSTNINAVANNETNINAVNSNSSNINSVASNETNINAVNSNSSNINSVANNETNINSVVSNATNINVVATNISNVNTLATNITGVNSFSERYRVESSDPSTSLDAGDLVFNTTSSELKYYSGSSWNVVASQDQAAKVTTNDTSAGFLDDKILVGSGLSKTVNNSGGNETLTLAATSSFDETVVSSPTANQTVFSITYTVGRIQVFVNGIKLINGTDFTATNGTSVTLTTGVDTSDVVEFVEF